MASGMKVSRGWSFLYNATLKMENKHFRGRLPLIYCLKRLRQHKIDKTKDFTNLPLVRTEIEGRSLVVPLAHNLAFYKEKFAHYDKHIISICQYVQSRLGALAFIDVGANVGDTVINLGIADHAQYLCIEGDAFYYKLLRNNLGNYSYQYHAINCFLTDQTSQDHYYQVEHAVSSAKLMYTDKPVDSLQNGNPGGGCYSESWMTSWKKRNLCRTC